MLEFLENGYTDLHVCIYVPAYTHTFVHECFVLNNKMIKCMYIHTHIHLWYT